MNTNKMRKWSLLVLPFLMVIVLGEEDTKKESENSNNIPGPSPRDPMAISYYPSRRERPPKLEEVRKTIHIPMVLC